MNVGGKGGAMKATANTLYHVTNKKKTHPTQKTGTSAWARINFREGKRVSSGF